MELPIGGQRSCPLVATGSARSGAEWGDPLSVGGLGETDRVAGGDHRGNANLIFYVALRLSASGFGLYSRSERNRRSLGRPPVAEEVSSD